MNWFLYSLTAILFWSGSDLFSKIGSRADDTYSHWKMVMAVGTVMGLHAIYLVATGTPFSPIDILTYLPASTLYILSMIVGYAGLRYIELSLSSPVCNSSGAVAAILCFLFLQEPLGGLQLVGVVLVCAGVFAERRGQAGSPGKRRGPPLYPQCRRHCFPSAVLPDRRLGHLCRCHAAGPAHR